MREVQRRLRPPEQQALAVILRCFLDAVGGETGMVLGRDGDGRTTILSAWGRSEREAVTPWVPGTFVGNVFEADAAMVDFGLDEPGRSPLDGPDVRAVAAPILTDNGTVGVIYAGFAAPSELGENALCWVADSYARLAALCMTGDGLAAVIGASGFDPLTGCLDYSGVMEVLKGEIQRSQRHDRRLSCCFLDLDGFKRVNDSHGHLEGNRVLAGIGKSLRESARSHDAVGRFGGDEFVIVFPETGARAARRVAQRLRIEVRSATAALTAVPVDMSIGIAEWTRGSSAKQLVDRADEAMRDAKRGGGARVVARGSVDRRFDGFLELTRELMRGRDRGRLSPGGHRARPDRFGSLGERSQEAEAPGAERESASE